MSAVSRRLTWFYHEFGLASIGETGRNAYLIILARTCRMFAYGTNSLILGIFFSALHYDDHQIGFFMTLTLLGDVFLGTFLTLIADRVGRRRVLLLGSLMMILSGAVFALFENFWILLLAAILGVISITGGDFGPFRSIEESVLSQLTTPATRSDVLAWYVTTSTLGSSLGSEVSGRMIRALQERDGWTAVDAYHALFLLYTAMGLVNVLLVLPLSAACELQASSPSYAQVPQDEADHGPDVRQPGPPQSAQPAQRPQGLQPPHNLGPSQPATPSRTRRVGSWLTSRMGQISAPTRSIMYKLWFLLAVDSLADGMVPYSLTNYYMDVKFHPSKSTLGDVTSVSYLLGAVGAVFAGPLAKHIGLINTMVFTHVPSSAAVLVFPAPPYFWMTALLLYIRAGLNNMDQAPRSSFIAAVVKLDERTAVMGITSMLRTLASMAGPTVTGALASNDQFWVAFVVAGICRLAYDFGLYAMFVNMKLYQHEEEHAANSHSHESRDRRPRNDEESWELQSVTSSEGSGEGKEIDHTTSRLDRIPSLPIHTPGERVRSRSPHRPSSVDSG